MLSREGKDFCISQITARDGFPVRRNVFDFNHLPLSLENTCQNWSSLDRRSRPPAYPRIFNRWYVDHMRTMQIRPFPGSKIQITDLGYLIKERLVRDLVLWPDQALPLVGYMAWPNDPLMRERWLEAHRRNDHSTINELMQRLKIIQQHWARVADIVHEAKVRELCDKAGFSSVRRVLLEHPFNNLYGAKP
jgi:hypothetical protein